MNLKNFIIRQYVNHDSIEHIIGHDILIYIKTSIRYLALLAITFLVYRIVRVYIDTEMVTMIFGVIGLMTYAFFVMRILNDYFDAILITRTGITLLTRNGFLQYKTETIYWPNVEMITYEQNGLVDAARNIGDIVVRIEHDITFPFQHVSQPKKQAAIIAAWKEQSMYPDAKPEEIVEQPINVRDEKFDVLVETLGEVIVEYMQRKEQK